VKGKLESFDDAAQRGVIVGDDGYRYTFTLTEWRGRGLPREGSRLRFDGDAGRAEQVFDAPVPQRTARQRRDDQGQVKSSLLSPWAVLALVLVTVAPLLASYMLHRRCAGGATGSARDPAGTAFAVALQRAGAVRGRHRHRGAESLYLGGGVNVMSLRAAFGGIKRLGIR